MTPAPAASPWDQLDLFIDGRDAILVHEVVTALAARDPARAGPGLARLEREHPAHPDLPVLGLLAEALRAPAPEPPTHATVTARIEEIERRVAPAARRFLGPQATSWLRPVWQALAAAAAAVPFDEGHPRAHPGWLGQQCGDWPAVRDAIEREPDWRARPLLRCWMGLAQHHLGAPDEAVRLWLPLCWMEPAIFAGHAPGLPSASLREAWEAFERSASFDEALAEATDATAWFPAWLLVRIPGLANLFRAEDAPGLDAPRRAFRTLLSLLPLEGRAPGDETPGQRRALAEPIVGQRRALEGEVIRRRRALQEISPAFFQHYLAAVSRRASGVRAR